MDNLDNLIVEDIQNKKILRVSVWTGSFKYHTF